MRSIFALMILASLVSCGEKPRNRKPPAPIELTEISSVWINDNQNSVFSYLDLTYLSVNSYQPSSDIIECDGHYGNNGNVNGVSEGMVYSSGDRQNGTIQIGHLPYVGSSNLLACRAASKELYSYMIIGQTLILQNIGYCSNHACQNDGVEVFQLGEGGL